MASSQMKPSDMARMKSERMIIMKKQQTARVLIPKDRLNNEDVLVSVNDRNYLIKRGVEVELPLEAAEILAKEGIGAEVINMSTIKPLDGETLVTSVRKTGCVVTAEEHSVVGGLGSAVAETLAKSYPRPVEMVGTRDTFGESGKPDLLFKKYGLTTGDIVEAAKKSISRKE